MKILKMSRLKKFKWIKLMKNVEKNKNWTLILKMKEIKIKDFMVFYNNSKKKELIIGKIICFKEKKEN